MGNSGHTITMWHLLLAWAHEALQCAHSDHLKMYSLHRETNCSGKRDTLRKTVQVNESQPGDDDSKGYTACACSTRAGTQPPPLDLLPLGLPSGRMLVKSSRVVGRR